MQRLKNKTALVTAAAQGIGRAVAERFAAEGAQVIATDINESGLANLRDMQTRHLDVTDGGAISKLVTELGAVDVLFNCAGYVHHGTVLECAERDFDFSFELNAKSIYRMMQAFLPGMLEAGHGVILNVSSVVSSIKGVPNRFAYGASKAAIIGMSKAVAADFIDQGIRCTSICPATVESPSLDERIAEQAKDRDTEEVRRAFIARQPIGRLGKPEEIAALAAYLASDEAAYTTGGVQIIDGGWCN